MGPMHMLSPAMRARNQYQALRVSAKATPNLDAVRDAIS